MKSRTVGAKWDGRTDMMKLTVAFRNFMNAPKTYFSSALVTFLCNLEKKSKTSGHTV